MIFQTNPPTRKTLVISLLTFIAGGTLWFTMPEFAIYAVMSMMLGYLILLGGSLLKGV